ncbi:MAG: efflux RND transporter permease subunit, partial [Syntrophomonadaceae bacterium]|nr:efflux RND transporter permease subunit [Syntrophomonadaceae bacterium]
MKIVNFAVKRPVATIILVSVILILAFFTYSKLAVDLYPEMKLPYAAVITTYPGTGPEEVESQVTKPLEGTLNSLSNVKEIQSVSSAGSSMILISFNWGTDMGAAISDIREKTGMIETFLPSGAETPMVLKMDLDMMPVVQMGISASDDMSLAQLQSIAEEFIEPRLARIGDIAQVTITGGLEREIKVDVDPVKLENYGLTLSGVNQVLQAENFNMSSGKVKEGQREYYVRSLQEFENIDDIKDVAILTSSGNRINLNDIATITDGYKDDNQITRVNGKPAVGIHCVKQSDANTVAACEAVKAAMVEIEKELGMDLDVQIIMDQSKYIRDTLKTTQKMMVEGGLLAVFVLFIFLRNVRSTFIVFIAIPLSIITTFILMYFNNSTINIITMGGLALGIGRMVDDSIVVFENIYRHRSMGLPPLEAAMTGASEVGSAVIASTVTIMAVFFPILFAEGIAGVLFKPLAITVSFAIFCSLMVALTVVPLMSSRMLTDKSMQPQLTKGKIAEWFETMGSWLDGLGEKYKVLLSWALSHRRRVVLIVTVLMIGSLALIPLIGAEFMPKMDSGEISVSIETDKGSLLKATDETVADVEGAIKSIPEVVTIFSSIGSSSNMMFNTGTQNDRASLYIKLLPKDERNKDVDTIAEEIREKVGNIAGAIIKVSVTDASSMGGTGGPINVQVRGDDLEMLEQISAQVTDIVRKVPGTREVTSSLDKGNPEVQVKIDRKRAAAYGLTPRQIAAEIQNAMLGSVASTYKNEGDEYNIRVRYAPENHKELDYLENLPILTQAGAVVRLSQVASFSMEPGPVEINRLDRVRTATISGYL